MGAYHRKIALAIYPQPLRRLLNVSQGFFLPHLRLKPKRTLFDERKCHCVQIML